MPRVSIGLPVFNGEKFLCDALDSILAQTFRDFELIISDNASTDRTREICESYAAKDDRVQLVYNDVNLGAARNYNIVVERSTGEYFKWAAHDDVCAPEFLERCVAVLDKDPSIVLCYPKMVDIDDDGKNLGTRDISHIPRSERGAYPTPHERFRRLIRTDYTCEEVFGLMRLTVLRRTKLILSYTDSDRTLLAELALHGRFHEVPEVLFYHRMHQGMSTKVFANWSERVSWFDPARAGKPAFPLCRQFSELVKSVVRAPLRARERTLCLFWMGPWIRDQSKDLTVELIRGVTQKLHLGRPRKSFSTDSSSRRKNLGVHHGSVGEQRPS
jgi:glycosyltransferase involved in cell wall biosynthesis